MQVFLWPQALILMICYYSYHLCLDGILLGDNVLQCNEVVRGRQTGAYGCKTPQPCQFFRFNDRSIHPCLCLFFQALFWRWDWKNWIEENTEFLFHKLVLIHPGHKCWHQVLFKWPQNALRPVVLVHSMHSCCRSTRKKRDRCNSPSEEGDRSPSHSSSCLWWWWTIRVDCVIHLQSRVMGPPSASQLQNGKPVSKIWQHVRLTHRNVNGPTKF